MNLRRVTPLAACLFLAALPAARAAEPQRCETRALQIMGRYLGVAGFASRTETAALRADACKRAPWPPGLLLVATAHDPAPADANATEPSYRKTLTVAMVDDVHARVVSLFQQDIEEDAVMEIGTSSLALDTARWQLRDDARAFGLRLNSVARGASCGEADWNDQLTLYLPEGARLRPVLSMPMFYERALSGCLGSASDHSVVEAATLTATIAATRTNGYADILVRAAIETTRSDDQAPAVKPRTETYLVHYDGTHYVFGATPPWWLASL
jgi:hypothetical protein